MTRVFRLRSTLEIPVEELVDYLAGDPDLPESVASVDCERGGDELVLRPVPADRAEDSPATLYATVSEVTLTEEPERPQWGQTEEPTSQVVEIATFEGDRTAVIRGDGLRYELFVVLCDLAELAERGELTAIIEVDGDLRARRYVAGEQRPASVDVVEDPSAREGSIDWRSNQYIGD